MSVVQFKVVQAPDPVLFTLYGVRVYWNDRGALAEGRLQQFANMELALRAGQEAARRSPAVRVYRIRGNAEVDYWEEPVTVARYGERSGELRKLPYRS